MSLSWTNSIKTDIVPIADKLDKTPFLSQGQTMYIIT